MFTASSVTQQITMLMVFSACIAMCAPSRAVDFDDGGVGSDWNTADNWDPNGVPGVADNVFVGEDNAYGVLTIDISATPTNQILQLGLGRGEAAKKTINHTAGDLVTNSWTNIGQGGSDHGVYNLSGTGTVTKNGGGLNILGGFDNATGELHISGTGIWRVNSGDTRIAGELTNQANTTGIVTVSDSGQFIQANSTAVGEGGTGSFTVSDTGSFTTGNLLVGVAGTGTLTYGSTATSTVGGQLQVGFGGFDGMGTLNVSSGRININGGNLNVGRDNSTTTPELNITGGTVDTTSSNPNLDTVIAFNGRGHVNVSGTGTLVTDWLIVGETAGSDDAQLNVSGNGTVDTNRISLGLNGSTNGQIEVTGSNATVTSDLLDVLTAGSNTMSWIGDAAGVSEFDVNGNVTLGNASLSVDLSQYTGSATTLTLIDKLTAGGVGGTFLGLAEGASVLGTGLAMDPTISYLGGGGDNNNVVLNGVFAPSSAPEPSTVILAALGMMGLALRRSTKRKRV